MAIVAHLVERADAPGKTFINGIRAVIVAIDDATYDTDAKIRTQAATLCQGEGQDLPDDYFDANRGIAATWNADEDVTIFTGSTVAETIA